LAQTEVLEESCPGVTNLTATINPYNTVTLNWTSPPRSEWPAEYIEYLIYDGENRIGNGNVYVDTVELNSWTTYVLGLGTHNLGVEMRYFTDYVHLACSSDTASVEVVITETYICPPITNLTATVNSDNTVTLNWTNPPQNELPSDKPIYWFFDGETNIGANWKGVLTSWQTPILEQGIHNLGVRVSYLEGCYLCTTDTIFVEAHITKNYTCPSVKKLEAKVNADKTVTLRWKNPDPRASNWPSACSGNLNFRFYLGNTYLGDNYSDNLTTWTSDKTLPNGTHKFRVIIRYVASNGFSEVCESEASTIVTVKGSFDCPSVKDFNTIENEDSTINLSWTLPTELPDGCNGDIGFYFWSDFRYLGYDDTDDLTSWTTPVISVDKPKLTVVIYYYDDNRKTICFAEANNGNDLNMPLFSAEIFPNPANDILTIKCDSEIVSYELYDALGRLVQNKTEVANAESHVNLSSLKQGMYMLRLNTVNGSGTFKIIKN